MANPEHLAILKQGVEVWNKWREENPSIEPDLRETNLDKASLDGANLSKAMLRKANLCEAKLNRANFAGANLSRANLVGASLIEADLSQAFFSGANLCGVNLSGAYLIETFFRGANLSGADFTEAHVIGADIVGSDLSSSNLSKADFSEANLSRTSLRSANLSEVKLVKANLSEADLSHADLSKADCQRSLLLSTKFNGAILSGCRIYGISAWQLELEGAEQKDLIITQHGEPVITVDNLEIAQFVYLLLNRKKLRNIIDTITSKAVLILGRFTPDRKAVLNAMADELRKNNLVPIIFDFERASSRDFTETIKTLAGMSLFVIADITNPSSAPLELQATVPDYQIPFVPILQEGEKPFSMLADLKSKYQWVLPLLKYPSSAVLIQVFKKAIIEEAFEMHRKLLRIKADAMETRNAEDYLREPVE